MKRFIQLACFLLLPIHSLFAQTNKKIQIENANSLEFDESLGVKAQRLIGNVIFSHEGALMYCDSAYFFNESNRLEAFSNVRIVSDSVTLTGNKLDYDGREKLAVITGNVFMEDPSSTLKTDELVYDTRNKTGRYTTGGVIRSKTSNNELTSVFGNYHSSSGFFYFKKKVVLKNDNYTMYCDTLDYNSRTEVAYFKGSTRIIGENKIYCENGYYDTQNDISEFNEKAVLDSKGQKISAQRIFYDRKNGLGRARDRVTIIDSTQNTIINGGYADYDEKENRLLVTRKPLLRMEVDGDTLYLMADTLRNISIPETDFKKLFAYHGVRFYKTDLQGQCDSLVYSTQDSLMELFRKPVLWNDDNQLNADSCQIRMANGKIDKIYLVQNAFISSEIDSIRFNQIKGRKITGFFVESKLRKILVEGNGQSIYYAESDSAEYIGVNKAECTNMVIYIDSNQVSSIIFIKDPDATLYPLFEVPAKELLLRGFAWLGDLRATRKEDITVGRLW
ncbi:MAG: OstA-like protein [Flavobacteriales bacterium]